MLRGIKASVLLASVAVVGLALWAGAQVEPTGSRMAVTADRLLDSLTQTQAAKAAYPYDSAERLNWHFIPRGRKGLPIKELSPEQRALAFALIQSGLSGSGFLKATTIMSLEQILRELEKGSGPVRDPELYYLTVFGKPETMSRPRISASGSSGSGKADPRVIFTSSAVRSPSMREYSFFIHATIAWSRSSPAVRMDRLVTMPPREITATSVVPPPT